MHVASHPSIHNSWEMFPPMTLLSIPKVTSWVLLVSFWAHYDLHEGWVGAEIQSLLLFSNCGSWHRAMSAHGQKHLLICPKESSTYHDAPRGILLHRQWGLFLIFTKILYELAKCPLACTSSNSDSESGDKKLSQWHLQLLHLQSVSSRT